ncbi:hypothetical protein GQ55_5G408100 [Panicum hallii var. hallii]|uniref:Uncharacterized protein n=1 Tax=Panicum hallii var. hallii TaxID=1504633 RepID=A0A2T7DNL9_9POAL|nr:hypothetical protein GQ55_5G408100 [Panicum hallii var. hallii]
MGCASRWNSRKRRRKLASVIRRRHPWEIAVNRNSSSGWSAGRRRSTSWYMSSLRTPCCVERRLRRRGRDGSEDAMAPDLLA